MKVGDILKKDVQNSRGLKLPYKIIINENCRYPTKQIIENEIYLENCNIFLNDFHNKKTIFPHTSHSYNKKPINKFKIIESKINNNKPNKKLLLRKNTVNIPKRASIHKNFPILRLSTPKKKRNKDNSNSTQKIKKLLLNENSMFKNKLNKLKLLQTENNKITSNTTIPKKSGKTPTYKFKKVLNSVKIENFFNNRIKKIHIINTNKNPSLLGFRLENKMKKMNHIIYKLNKPIFINIKNEMN
jgi:hypothetical protein